MLHIMLLVGFEEGHPVAFVSHKLVLKKNQKRKTNEASTSTALSEEPTPHEKNFVDDVNFWANLNIEEEEAR